MTASRSPSSSNCTSLAAVRLSYPSACTVPATDCHCSTVSYPLLHRMRLRHGRASAVPLQAITVSCVSMRLLSFSFSPAMDASLGLFYSLIFSVISCVEERRRDWRISQKIELQTQL
ncbi:MurR/RpiR family transcriptional regulator [Sesbania bispinosa]|nr:MurR/RpiR family transcriptional regulator [Sesbania bispinosa]